MKFPLKKLVQQLDDYLESPTFSDHGPNGLQVEGKSEIKKVATAVSASLETIEKCINGGFDALIVHHGLFWSGDSYCVTGSLKQKLELLLSRGVSLLAYHLPLDAHREVGNNWRAAEEMGWNDLEPFGEYKGKLIGVKGKFKAQTLDQFTKKLEKYYGHKATIAPCGSKKIASAALISGGAWREIKKASSENVDAYITGNFDEPAWWLAREEGIHFFALGHFATERIGVRALAKYIEERCKIPTKFLDLENPF